MSAPTCTSESCSGAADSRYFWPGREPQLFCAPCGVRARRVADAMGFGIHSEPLHKPTALAERLRPPEELTLNALSAEVSRARLKFPMNRFLLAALMEEVGELAKALLQKRPRDEWEREAIQVACVAIRIIEEGDSSFEGITDEEAKP